MEIPLHQLKTAMQGDFILYLIAVATVIKRDRDLTILDSERSARIERRTIIIRIPRIAVFHLVCALCLTGFSIKAP